MIKRRDKHNILNESRILDNKAKKKDIIMM